MELKPQLNAQSILEKKFKPGLADYDALEVDRFLDQIRRDYEMFEKFMKEVLPILLADQQVTLSLRKRIAELEVDITKSKEKLGVLKGNDTSTINLKNLELIQRIAALEKAIYNLGHDPNKIK